MTKDGFKMIKDNYLLNQFALLSDLQKQLDQIETEFDEPIPDEYWRLLINSYRHYRNDFIKFHDCKMSEEEELLWDVLFNSVPSQNIQPL